VPMSQGNLVDKIAETNTFFMREIGGATMSGEQSKRHQDGRRQPMRWSAEAHTSLAGSLRSPRQSARNTLPRVAAEFQTTNPRTASRSVPSPALIQSLAFCPLFPNYPDTGRLGYFRSLLGYREFEPFSPNAQKRMS
jgi:hypothetical protein